MSHFDPERVYHRLMHVEDTLDRIVTLLRSIIVTQAELTAQVQAANDKLTKIGGETRGLLTKIDELTALIASGPPVTPELKAAVDALTAQAQVVDDLVPDVPAPESARATKKKS